VSGAMGTRATAHTGCCSRAHAGARRGADRGRTAPAAAATAAVAAGTARRPSCC
jgi:hypothetical protein